MSTGKLKAIKFKELLIICKGIGAQINITVEKVEGGGVPGLLKQLGVEVPMEVHSY